MSAFLLTVHVLAAILAIGPIAVVASMFPRSARQALEAPFDARKVATVQLLHRVTKVYAVVGVLVPVFGIATGASIGVLGDLWLIISIIITAVAAVLLIFLILPKQQHIVDSLSDDEQDLSTDDGQGPGSLSMSGVGNSPGLAADLSSTRQLAMFTGVFNLLWAVVVVLMIYRPGSTTGVGI